MMLLSGSRWTPELTEENENKTEVSTDAYAHSISSNFEHTDDDNRISSSSSSISSTMADIDGRRIYCSGRDLHAINTVRKIFFVN